MNELGCLLGHRRNHSRMSMAERVNAQASHQVQVTVPGSVVKIDTFAAVHYNGVACVDWEQVIGVAIENALSVGILPEKIHDYLI
jgi:hypothetical protein